MDSRLAPFTLQELGVFRCDRTRNYENARQGSLETSNEIGRIDIHPGFQFEQSAEDLRGFSHLWIIFQFHQAKNWKPMVSPPTSTRKRGVFSTRSPHRPNQLGLSVVEIVSIEGRSIFVKNFDLLDGTPIWDIKPYVTTYDSVPEAKLGWTAEPVEEFSVDCNQPARLQLQWLQSHGLDLLPTIQRSLRYKPFDTDHKRVEELSDHWELAIKTWRVFFAINPDDPRRLMIEKMGSGYSKQELNASDDPYLDKELHRAFIKFFKIDE